MDNVYILKESLNKWVAKYFIKDLINIDELISCIEDLDAEIENLNEKIEQLIKDREENYKRIDYASQIRED